MKTLRTMALMLVVAAVSFSAKQSFAQFEIAPDHFDQPVAAKANATHKVTAHHSTHAKATLASKHGKQHRSHATA
jgi:Skp family chaperone for outer membrane proteins